MDLNANKFIQDVSSLVAAGKIVEQPIRICGIDVNIIVIGDARLIPFNCHGLVYLVAFPFYFPNFHGSVCGMIYEDFGIGYEYTSKIRPFSDSDYMIPRIGDIVYSLTIHHIDRFHVDLVCADKVVRLGNYQSGEQILIPMLNMISHEACSGVYLRLDTPHESIEVTINYILLNPGIRDRLHQLGYDVISD